jgi:hypothetical protein
MQMALAAQLGRATPKSRLAVSRLAGLLVAV